jgi:hypothetical protein
MLRHLKPLIALASVMALAQQICAFTLWTSPMFPWQTAALCYGTRYWYSAYTYITNNGAPLLPGNVGYTELGGPSPTIYQGSRMNVGVTTYAYDSSFILYYGKEGMKAVDAAFAILNNLPSASSANLSKFITLGNQQVNYSARALSMLDLKSTVLQLMIEHMGLLGETHVWDMYAQQAITGGAACQSAYIVVNDNFDAATWSPSTYVNGISYGYQILDGCSQGLAFTDAMEEVYDTPGMPVWSAVATQEALQTGGYYLNITRDDMGGLRYLYCPTNFRYETMFTDVYPSGQQTVVTSPWNPISGTNTTATNTTNTLPTLVGGVDKITFVKWANYNPLATNLYTNVLSYPITYISNYTIQKTILWRSNTVPDIIISATNLLTTTGTEIEDTPFQRTYAWIASPQPNFPSVMSPTMTLVINDVGPLAVNEGPNFVQGDTLFITPFFQFGSFDGSTNPPIVFPTGSSVAAETAIFLTPPPGQSTFISPFNSVVTTNTVTATGTTAGTVNGNGVTTAANPAERRPAGGSSN